MDWFDRVPKAELHLHLEGAIPMEAMWRLLEKYGGDPAIPDQAALSRRFSFVNFEEFIRGWIWKNTFLREYEDFTFIAEALARSLATQKIRYAEVFFSPPCFGQQGLSTQRLTEAIRHGFSRAGGETEIHLIADLVRDQGPIAAERTLHEVQEVREFGVIGIGIGGFEAYHPPQLFTGLYERARSLGFRTTAHAGETLGAQSVQSVLEDLRVDRIGHATRALEDPWLLEKLASLRIPLEMCPLSNIATGVLARIHEHPVRDFFDKGLMVTINTDDPLMFGNTLAKEFRTLSEVFGFTPEEIRRLILNSLEAAWLDEEERHRLIASFENDPNWLENPINAQRHAGLEGVLESDSENKFA